jgi:hypothetical protein
LFVPVAQTVPGVHGRNVGKNGKYGKNGKNGGKNGPGTIGVTEFDAAEDKESTTPLFSLTVKVYAVPFVNPVTVTGEDDEVPVIFPGLEVAIYVVPAGFPK